VWVREPWGSVSAAADGPTLGGDSMSTYRENDAESWAREASSRQGEGQLTDAVGEGLAAIACALLEVAAAIREAADKVP
jgi:hypothetical protein